MREKEKMLSTSISPFPTMFSKRFFFRFVKSRGLCGLGLVRPANGFVTEGKRTKHTEFGYSVTILLLCRSRL